MSCGNFCVCFRVIFPIFVILCLNFKNGLNAADTDTFSTLNITNGYSPTALHPNTSSLVMNNQNSTKITPSLPSKVPAPELVHPKSSSNMTDVKSEIYFEGGSVISPPESKIANASTSSPAVETRLSSSTDAYSDRNIETGKKGIVPRKGVKFEGNVTDIIVNHDVPSSVKNITKTDSGNVDPQPPIVRLNQTGLLPSNSSSALKTNGTTTTKTPEESHSRKRKPGLTDDEDELPHDANGKVIVNEEMLNSGPETDYVVPIVIAMLAVPLIAAFGAIMYKRGRDFWERRHYRRMDFLIDGMYND